MEIIPDTEAYRITAQAATNNFEMLGAEVQEPNKVIYGFTPKGGASYDAVTDTIYMGAKTAASDDRIELATFEHENIHYEQFRRILGESPENLYGKVADIENQALNTAIKSFDDGNFIDAITHDQHLNHHNFQTMMGLATRNEEFLSDLHDLREIADERTELVDDENPGVDASAEEISYNAAAVTAEETAENYWDQILETRESDRYRELIERYNVDIEDDDILEAQAQFWSLFTIGMLEDLPETEGVYPEIVDKQVESLEWYAHKEHYNRGENVEEETRNLIEIFRERKHSENKNDDEIAVEILNDGLEHWERKKMVSAD